MTTLMTTLEWSYWLRNAKFYAPANPRDGNLRAYVECKRDAKIKWFCIDLRFSFYSYEFIYPFEPRRSLYQLLYRCTLAQKATYPVG